MHEKGAEKYETDLSRGVEIMRTGAVIK